MLTDRTSKILEAVIQGFIDTGEPVSSSWLFEKCDFGIKSAMIRHELEELSNMGFLEQPYRSAGRMPTDKGYEFFANKILESESGEVPEANGLMSFLNKMAFDDFFGEFSQDFGLA